MSKLTGCSSGAILAILYTHVPGISLSLVFFTPLPASILTLGQASSAIKARQTLAGPPTCQALNSMPLSSLSVAPIPYEYSSKTRSSNVLVSSCSHPSP